MAGSDKDVDYMDYSAMDFQESAFDSVKKNYFLANSYPLMAPAVTPWMILSDKNR